MADNNPAAVSDPNPDNVEDDNQTILLDANGAPKEDGKPPVAAPVVADPKDSATDTPVTYEPTGDTSLDMALEFVGKAGIGIDHPAMKAAAEGNFDVLRAVLAAKGVPGWEQHVKLGEEAFKRQSEAATAKQSAAREVIYKEAGSKEEWVAIQKWASANATDQEREETNALLNQGGIAAKGAVRYLKDAYNRANNVVVEPKDGLGNAGRAGAPTGSNSPLSPKDYAIEVGRLNHKLGGRLEGSKEYASLQARRLAYQG